MTKVLKCRCEYKQQDALYGEGNRLHNRMPSTDRPVQGWRCTVCGNEKKP